MKHIAIGLLGAGNVGAGVVRILQENREAIERRLGARVVVNRVLVRDKARERHASIDPALLTTEVDDVLTDPQVRVVVELIGGIEPARSHVLQAIDNGKHVVSANKALFAIHGKELFAAAARRGVWINFEASVAGGIPILRSLREGLASDRIESITGIVNGTCNYMLDSMTRTGASYDDALKQAQEAGFAEADPSLDVEGKDAAQKLAILALLGFGVRVDPEAIPAEGITRLRPFDIDAAGQMGFVFKSLATARETENGLVMRVHTALVPRSSILAGVHGSYNAVLVESRALGRSLYYGRGAGMMPTGMAVVSDIIEVCRSVVAFADGAPPPEAFGNIVEGRPVGGELERYQNYVCVHVPNIPGVLGRVAGCLGRHGVSVEHIRQNPEGPGKPVDMVILTELVEERQVDGAIKEIDQLDEVLAPSHRFRICRPDPID